MVAHRPPREIERGAVSCGQIDLLRDAEGIARGAAGVAEARGHATGRRRGRRIRLGRRGRRRGRGNAGRTWRRAGHGGGRGRAAEIHPPHDLVAVFQPAGLGPRFAREKTRPQLVRKLHGVRAAPAVDRGGKRELLAVGRPHEFALRGIGNRDAADALVQPGKVDPHLVRTRGPHGGRGARGYLALFRLRRGPSGLLAVAPFFLLRARRLLLARLHHLLHGLRQRPVAPVTTVVVGPEPHVVDVDLGLDPSPGEGEQPAVGRPRGIAFVIGMTRDVHRLAGTVGRKDPDVAVEVCVVQRRREPLSIRTPFVLGHAPSFSYEAGVATVGIDGPQVAALPDEGESLAVGAPLEVLLDGGVVRDACEREAIVAPPVIAGPGPLRAPDVTLPFLIADEIEAAAIGGKHRGAFLFRRARNLAGFTQDGVHHPHITAGDERDLESVVGERDLRRSRQRPTLGGGGTRIRVIPEFQLHRRLAPGDIQAIQLESVPEHDRRAVARHAGRNHRVGREVRELRTTRAR